MYTEYIGVFLYSAIVQRFYSNNHKKYRFIPVEERNSDFIIVLTEQFLRDAIGPTKTAKDRCRIIMEKMGKRLLLINTAETMSTVGEIPFVNIKDAKYISELSDLASIQWEGVTIPYFQCEQNMPEYDTMNLILDLITERKPYCIISMNGSSITSNLANQIVPVIAINCGLSRIAVTTVSFQALGQKITEEQKKELASCGLPESSVIESEFTYSFRKQTEHYTRNQFELKENVFLIAVIGMRLDSEITYEFCNLLNDIVNDDREVVFVGKFKIYKEIVQSYPNLGAHSYYIGSISDVVAFGEICDLFVNPTRREQVDLFWK